VKGELRALDNFRGWLRDKLRKRRDPDDKDAVLRAACLSALSLLDIYAIEKERECAKCQAGDPYHWIGHPCFVEKKP